MDAPRQKLVDDQIWEMWLRYSANKQMTKSDAMKFALEVESDLTIEIPAHDRYSYVMNLLSRRITSPEDR